MSAIEFEGNYVDVKFIKRVLGFESVRRVQQLSQDGALVTCEVREGKRNTKRYDLCPTVLSYIEYLKERPARAFGDQKEQKILEKMQAEIDYKSAKARMAEIELDELAGHMHAAEDVEKMTADLCLAVRSMLLALPGQLAVDVAAVDTAPEAQVIIKEAVCHILDELSRYKYDPKEYKRRVMERKEWQDAGEEPDE